MSEAQQARFECQSCGKSYAWKPELAGKKARCKCGAVMDIPQRVSAGEDDLDRLYDLAEDDAPPRPRVAPTGAAAAPAAGTANGQRCPSCGSAMEPGAVLCLTCGFNLKIGRKMNTAVGAAGSVPPIPRPPAGPSKAAAVPPGIGPVKMKPAKYEYGQSGQKKMLLLGGIAILLVGGLVAAFLVLRETPPSVQLKGEDAAILAQMKEERAIPADQFLQKTGRIISGMTTSQATRYVQNLKEMGAVEVFAADTLMTRYLVIELPEDPAQRKALFDYENKWHVEMHEKPATDVGQRYLKLKMRL